MEAECKYIIVFRLRQMPDGYMMDDPKKILIIDDDKIVAEALRMVITKTADRPMEVDIALNGRDGLDSVVFNQYDIIFMDLRMPHWNGVEMIRTLKMLNNHARIVIYSGCANEFAEELEDIQVDAILTKPSPVKKIHDTLEELLVGC